MDILPRWAFHTTQTFYKLFLSFLCSVFHIMNPVREKPPHISDQVRLHCLADGTICKSVLSASRFHRTPGRAMCAGLRTIRHHLFYPGCPLTLSSWLPIHIHTPSFYLSVPRTHTHSLWWWIFLRWMKSGERGGTFGNLNIAACLRSLSANSGSRQSVCSGTWDRAMIKSMKGRCLLGKEWKTWKETQRQKSDWRTRPPITPCLMIRQLCLLPFNPIQCLQLLPILSAGVLCSGLLQRRLKVHYTERRVLLRVCLSGLRSGVFLLKRREEHGLWR